MSRTFVGATPNYLTSSSNLTINAAQSQTICAWIYPTSFAGNTGSVAADTAAQIAGASGGDGYLCVTKSSSGVGGILGGLITTAKAVAASAVSVDNTLVLNQWQFIALVFNASTGVLRLYRNGVEVSYASQTNNTGTLVTTRPFFVGAQDTVTASEAFTGSIDTVAIWNTALTAAQLVTAMKFQGPLLLQTNLTQYWPLKGAASPEPALLVNTLPLTVAGAAIGPASPGQTAPFIGRIGGRKTSSPRSRVSTQTLFKQ